MRIHKWQDSDFSALLAIQCKTLPLSFDNNQKAIVVLRTQLTLIMLAILRKLNLKEPRGMRFYFYLCLRNRKIRKQWYGS